LFRRFLFLLVFAIPLNAKLIRVDPPAPTSATPVRVLIAAPNGSGCSFVFDGVGRSGSNITLRYHRTSCLNTPTSWSEVVPLGPLPPGVFTISVVVEGSIRDSYDLIVSDANAPLKLFPSSKAARAIEQVQISSERELLCDTAGCVKPTIIFGGMVVPDQFVTVVDAHTVLASTTPHDAGLVDVTVKTPTQTITAVSAFRFYANNTAPDPAIFERILLPIVYNGFGAFDSWWRTDLNIFNGNPVFFGSGDAVRPLFYFQHCSFEACPGSLQAGGSADALDPLAKSPSGLLLMPQRDLASGLRFSYRAWEAFQSAKGLSSGTELPIVRERDFRTGKLSLVNVPLDHHSRVALRFYGPDSEAMVVTVRVYAAGDPKPAIAQKSVRLDAPACSTDPCDAASPSFAIVSDLEQFFPEISHLDRVRIEIEPVLPYRFWAFVTITNNATQNVTTVTPQ
jgi:hypothetical protein